MSSPVNPPNNGVPSWYIAITGATPPPALEGSLDPKQGMIDGMNELNKLISKIEKKYAEAKDKAEFRAKMKAPDGYLAAIKKLTNQLHVCNNGLLISNDRHNENSRMIDSVDKVVSDMSNADTDAKFSESADQAHGWVTILF